MCWRATWWLVITRPSGETKEPEPLGKRTDDFWTCSYHLSSLSKPYFSARYFLGGLENSHMPSSARRAGASRVNPSQRDAPAKVHFFIVRISLLKTISPAWVRPSRAYGVGGGVSLSLSRVESFFVPTRRRIAARIRKVTTPMILAAS